MLSFVFVQLLLLPQGTTINASGKGFEHAPSHGGGGLAMTQPIPTPFCNLTTVASSNEHLMSWLIRRPHYKNQKHREILQWALGRLAAARRATCLPGYLLSLCRYVPYLTTVTVTGPTTALCCCCLVHNVCLH
ncbi:hypothetical protein HPB47_012349 [Ixodes persulcatus]|uniref:Uncharacterized protein n=1 Tax=Ixodes persulcatus TaxID=34615 RepID=A0AC60NTS0_IXOPE|nr:hypothetical protein HPB47_012349 [Ixodes persulcatus]